MSSKTSGVWNKDRHVGPRQPFSLSDTQKIDRRLHELAEIYDRCLFCVGIDTMLRGSDLIKLKVFDLIDQKGVPRQEILRRQKKTDQNVAPVLTPTTQAAILDWVLQSGKRSSDYLFTRKKPVHGRPISEGHLRGLVKEWAKSIGLDPERYSGHSLRRTKATYLYKYGFADISLISRLLGHKSVQVTLTYLGITQAEAQAAALTGDMFDADTRSAPLSHPILHHLLTPEFLEPFAQSLARHIAPKSPDFVDENPKKSR